MKYKVVKEFEAEECPDSDEYKDQFKIILRIGGRVIDIITAADESSARAELARRGYKKTSSEEE